MSSSETHSDTHHEHGIRTYVIIFIALLALLGAAVGVAYIPAGDHAYRMRFCLTFIAYTIAVVKGVLIILWFMHVKESSRLTWLFAGASFFFILIMIGLVLNDYSTRPVIPAPYTRGPATPFTAQPVRHAAE